jgi:hypothetical protein
MSINDQLAQLYSAHWDDLIKHGAEVCSPPPTNPLLLKLDEGAFASASKRILICGQESAWARFGTSIDDGMEKYFQFFIKGGLYSEVGGSSFWKAFRYFEREFRQLFGKDDCTFIWQNLSKMGRFDGENGVTPAIRQLERDHFPVLRDEMAILQPDIVLFLTGPNRDDDIRFHFPDVQLSTAGTESNFRRLAWLSSRDLPVASLRLYHPRYGPASTKEYKSSVVDLINQRCQRCEQDGAANATQPIRSETNSTPPAVGSGR